MHKIFWLENVKARDHSDDLGVDEWKILDWMLEE
jgi:hypothetical protein